MCIFDGIPKQLFSHDIYICGTRIQRNTQRYPEYLCIFLIDHHWHLCVCLINTPCIHMYCCETTYRKLNWMPKKCSDLLWAGSPSSARAKLSLRASLQLEPKWLRKYCLIVYTSRFVRVILSQGPCESSLYHDNSTTFPHTLWLDPWFE